MRTALEDAKATDAGNHTLALQAVQTEASRAEARETLNADAIAAETARALAAEEQLRLSIQGGSGSTDLLSARVTALEGSLAALQTLMSNQRTLIVANRQDMRGTDLGIFSEIVVLPGGTLVVSPAQEEQIRIKRNTAGQAWTLVFRNDGDLEIIAAEPLDVRADLPYLFTRLSADATVHMRGDQFLALSPTGTVAVDVASNIDLRGAPVSVNTTVNVLSGGEATVSPSQAQAMAGGTGLRVVASEPTDFALLGHVASPRVGHVVCEADCTFLSLPASLEKAGGAQVTLRVVEEQRFFDSTHTIDGRVDALDLRATAKMTPAQASSYAITKGSNGLLHVVLAGGGEVDLRPFSVGKYDALMLQGTDALVSAAQADALPSVHRDDGKVVLVVDDDNALPSDASFADTIDVLRSSVPITLNLAQALNVAVEHAPTVTLQLATDADLSVLNLNHVQRVESTRTVRLSHAQWKAMSHVSAATVILTVRSAEDLRFTSLDGVHTLECFDACKATVEQVQGKTPCRRDHAPDLLRGGHCANLLFPPGRAYLGGDKRGRSPCSIQAGSLIRRGRDGPCPAQNCRKLSRRPVDRRCAACRRVCHPVRRPVQGYFRHQSGHGNGDGRGNGRGRNARPRGPHQHDTNQRWGCLDHAFGRPFVSHCPQGRGLLYGSVKEDAVAADYPLVDGFYVQAGTITVRQADQGRVVSNHAVVRLEGATAAPTAPGEGQHRGGAFRAGKPGLGFPKHRRNPGVGRPGH